MISLKKYIFEQIQINEKHGSYDGQVELILPLANEIYSSIQNTEATDFVLNEEDLKGISNIFFKELIVNVNSKTSYVVNESNFLENEQKFDKVLIFISYNDAENYLDLCDALMHEMLHAFEHFQRCINKAKFTLKELTDIQSGYQSTRNSDKTTVSGKCKTLLHDIKTWEVNANINELSILFDKHEFDLNDYATTAEAYEDAISLFKNSPTWKRYSALYNFLQNIKSEEDKEEFRTIYNEINGTSLTFNKIYKKLDDLLGKIIERMEKHISKLFYDLYEKYFNDQEIKENKLEQISEAVKPENGEKWEVYFERTGSLDKSFTEWAQHWKKKPQVGKGWYAGGTIFKVVRIEDNKVYIEKDNTIKP